MKNLIKTLCIIYTLFFFTGAVFASNIFSADLQSRRIAEGTLMQLQFPEGLNSLQNNDGDYFVAVLKNDIKINKKTVLPAGSVFRGTVESISKSKRFKIPAKMYLDFDHIVMPNGRQLDVDFCLTGLTLTPDNRGLSGGGSYKASLIDGVEDSIDFVQNAIDWGNEQGDKFLAGYPKIIITPITALGAGCVGAASIVGKSIGYMFIKGNEVYISPEQTITGYLATPIDIPFK